MMLLVTNTEHVKKSECQSLSRVLLFEIQWIVAHQGPLSMEFSRQEYWSGLLFPSPRDLPNLIIKARSPALTGRLFTTSATWEACFAHMCTQQ